MLWDQPGLLWVMEAWSRELRKEMGLCTLLPGSGMLLQIILLDLWAPECFVKHK